MRVQTENCAINLSEPPSYIADVRLLTRSLLSLL